MADPFSCKSRILVALHHTGPELVRSYEQCGLTRASIATNSQVEQGAELPYLDLPLTTRVTFPSLCHSECCISPSVLQIKILRAACRTVQLENSQDS